MKMRVTVGLLLLAGAFMFCAIKARADFSIGVPTLSYWKACDTEEKAVKVAEVLVKSGDGAGLSLLNATEGCEAFAEMRALYAHRVVWHRENHQQEIVKVVNMSEWKDGVPFKHYFVITYSRVLGSGITGSLEPYYFPVRELTYPRTMSGLFCTTQESLRTVAENVPKMQLGAVHLVNKDKTLCVWHTVSRVIVERMKFVRTETVLSTKLYVYEATVSGFLFGSNRMRISPPAMQYLYMTDPQSPKDIEVDA